MNQKFRFWFLMGILFLVISLCEAPFQFSRYPGTVLGGGKAGGDEISHSAKAVGRDMPDLFQNDYFLGRPSLYAFYTPLFLSLVRWIGRRTGDYAVLYGWFGFGVVFIQLWGFFFLGHTLTKSKWTGFLLALASLANFVMPGLGEHWGTGQFLPKHLFQMLLPFVLMFAWRFRSRKWSWCIAFALIGVLVYIDPASALVWAGALSLGYLIADRGTWTTKIKWLALAIACFWVIACAYSVTYARGIELGNLSNPEREEYLSMWVERFTTHRAWAPDRVNAFLFGYDHGTLTSRWLVGGRWLVSRTFRYGALPILILALIAGMLALSEKETHGSTRWVTGWTIGVFISSAGVATLMDVLAQFLPTTPLDLTLVLRTTLLDYIFNRDIRYLIPLSLILILLGIQGGILKLGRKWAHPSWAVPACQMFFVLALFTWHPPKFIQGGWPKWNPQEVSQDRRDLQGALHFIKHQLPQDAVLVANQGPYRDIGDMVRVDGRRPVAYAWKDSWYFTRNPRSFILWGRRRQAAKKLLADLSNPSSLKDFSLEARSWGADWWLAPAQVAETLEASGETHAIGFKNGSYVLVDLAVG